MPGAGDPIPYDLVLLSWRERWCPQGEFECVHGERILLDLPVGTTLPHGARLFLPDGRNVEVIAAEEHLAEICGPHVHEWTDLLSRRRVPCQREPGRLLIARDAMLEHELRLLGASVRHVSEPFEPAISSWL
jgi:urease accessory protein